jgi:hypothetical protein
MRKPTVEADVRDERIAHRSSQFLSYPADIANPIAVFDKPSARRI